MNHFLRQIFWITGIVVIILSIIKNNTEKIPVPAEKYTALQTQSQQINMLFIGASRTYRSFDPAIVDSILNANGAAIKSFNLGKKAMGPLQANMMIDWVLGMDLPALKWIVFELEGIESEVVHQNIYQHQDANRLADFHDAKRAWLSCRVLAAMDMPIVEKMRAISEKSLLALRHYSLGGKGDDLIFEAAETETTALDKATYPATFNGFIALDEEVEEKYKKRLGRFLSKKGQMRYQSHLKAMQASESDETIRKKDKVNAKILLEMVEKCMARGIQVVFSVPPSGLGLEPLVAALKSLDAKTPIIHLSKMEQYPALYLAENRFDHFHLNRKGAVLASREMAFALLTIGEIKP